MHHLHRRTLSLSNSYHFKAFLGTRPGPFRKPCSGWRALAPSSSRAGRKDKRGTRQSTMGKELDCGSRGELPPFSYADRVFITFSSAMIASRNMSFLTLPKRQAYIYTASTSALRTSRLNRLPSSTSLHASGGSSSPRPTNYRPFLKSKHSRKKSAVAESGITRRSRVSSSARPSPSPSPPQKKAHLPTRRRTPPVPRTFSKSSSMSLT
jgi:hypothetical protein